MYAKRVDLCEATPGITQKPSHLPSRRSDRPILVSCKLAMLLEVEILQLCGKFKLHHFLQTAVYVVALRGAADKDAAKDFGRDSSGGATDPYRFGPTRPPDAASKLHTTSYLGARICEDTEHRRIQA